MNIFKGQNLLEFSARSQTDLDCKKYLSKSNGKKASNVSNVDTKLVRYARIFLGRATSVVIPSQLQPIPCSTR